jgi:hypothetical protein
MFTRNNKSKIIILKYKGVYKEGIRVGEDAEGEGVEYFTNLIPLTRNQKHF